MKLRGAQIVWECLVREGVEVAFGITGGQIMPVYHELRGYPSIHHVTVRHEQAAAMMAHAWSIYGPHAGVCLVTAGPGYTNALTGLVNASLDNVPIVVLLKADGMPALASALSDPRLSRPYSGCYWQVDEIKGEASTTNGLLRSRSLWDHVLTPPQDTPADGEFRMYAGGTTQVFFALSPRFTVPVVAESRFRMDQR